MPAVQGVRVGTSTDGGELMAFEFSPLTRLALARYGLTATDIGGLEQLEESARRAARALRVPSEAAMLRRRAKILDRQARRRVR